MKKTIITLSLILGITMTSFADGGLFNRGNNARNGQTSGYIYFNTKDPVTRDGMFPSLPPHGEGDNQPAPLGSGIALLTALGAGYVVAKKRREESLEIPFGNGVKSLLYKRRLVVSTMCGFHEPPFYVIARNEVTKQSSHVSRLLRFARNDAKRVQPKVTSAKASVLC